MLPAEVFETTKIILKNTAFRVLTLVIQRKSDVLEVHM
jgi:hypothetical protein